MLFSLPLMIVIQEISGRIGCVTGQRIAWNLRRHYPSFVVRTIVTLLLVANTINLGADLGAMGAALKLLIGGRSRLYNDRVRHPLRFGGGVPELRRLCRRP